MMPARDGEEGSREDEETCVICDELLLPGVPPGPFGVLSPFPCNHRFHGQCIFDYAHTNRSNPSDISCPLCRSHLPRPDLQSLLDLPLQPTDFRGEVAQLSGAGSGAQQGGDLAPALNVNRGPLGDEIQVVEPLHMEPPVRADTYSYIFIPLLLDAAVGGSVWSRG